MNIEMIKKILPISVVVLVLILILLVVIQRMMQGGGNPQNTTTIIPTLFQGRQINTVTPKVGRTPGTTTPIQSSNTQLSAEELQKKLPIVAPDFTLIYSGRMQRYVATVQSDEARFSYDEWLAKNPSYVNELQNTIVTKQSLEELNAALDEGKKNILSPEKKAVQDSKELSQTLNMINNLPYTLMNGLMRNELTPTPMPKKQAIPIPTQPITILPTATSAISSDLLPNPLNPLSSKALSFKKAIEKCYENRAIYDVAATQTGIAWEILAALHYNEGACQANRSLVSGRIIGVNEPDIVRAGGCSSGHSGPGIPIPLLDGGCGFPTLLDSAIYAGNHFKKNVGKIPTNFQELAKAFSRYSGGGNSNCGKTPYISCPRLFEGEDDAYVMNMFDKKHEVMYLVYCADLTRCDPVRLHGRPGVATIIRLITNQL